MSFLQALLNNTLPAHTDSLDELLQALLASTDTNAGGSHRYISKEVVWHAFKEIVSVFSIV